MPNNINKATFAGGCFWCMEAPFTEIKGVISVRPGYTGGKEKKPTYETVITGKTGHVEAIHIEYDESLVSYNTLLKLFWEQIDPTDETGQFVDRGDQYKTVIFYHSNYQKEKAINSKKALEKSGRFSKPIVTKIRQAEIFYLAEDYHQQYYKKHPEDYKRYKIGSGREQFIQTYWKRKKNEE
ncbi:peptide-methionine (S)-S-oxide reductase [bacterium]|nr:peptide-methionine (S)-S-oxide reductase [bacterium]